MSVEYLFYFISQLKIIRYPILLLFIVIFVITINVYSNTVIGEKPLVTLIKTIVASIIVIYGIELLTSNQIVLFIKQLIKRLLG